MRLFQTLITLTNHKSDQSVFSLNAPSTVFAVIRTSSLSFTRTIFHSFLLWSLFSSRWTCSFPYCVTRWPSVDSSTFVSTKSRMLLYSLIWYGNAYGNDYSLTFLRSVSIYYLLEWTAEGVDIMLFDCLFAREKVVGWKKPKRVRWRWKWRVAERHSFQSVFPLLYHKQAHRFRLR